MVGIAKAQNIRTLVKLYRKLKEDGNLPHAFVLDDNLEGETRKNIIEQIDDLKDQLKITTKEKEALKK